MDYCRHPQKKAVKYLSEHRVPAMVEQLVDGLVQARPGEDVLFRSIEGIMRRTCTARYKEWQAAVKEMKKGTFKEGMYFMVPEKPGMAGMELVPGGMEQAVTKENCDEFLGLVDDVEDGCLNDALLDGTFTLPPTEAAEGRLVTLGHIRNSLNIMLVTPYTEQEWDSFKLVWAAPTRGHWASLIPNGSTTPVSPSDKLKFILECKAAVEREEEALLDIIVKSSNNDNEKSGIRKLCNSKRDPSVFDVNLITKTPPCEKRTPTHASAMSPRLNAPPQDFRRFSPTHFAKDLFSPNSLGIPASCPPVWRERLNSYRQEFEPIVATMEEEEYDDAEWKQMEVSWCVYIDGNKVALIPNGDSKLVQRCDKDVYCEIARMTLNRTLPPPTEMVVIPPKVTKAEWGSLDVTWCSVSPCGAVRDLIPNGRHIPVHYTMRDSFMTTLAAGE